MNQISSAAAMSHGHATQSMSLQSKTDDEDSDANYSLVHAASDGEVVAPVRTSSRSRNVALRAREVHRADLSPQMPGRSPGSPRELAELKCAQQQQQHCARAFCRTACVVAASVMRTWGGGARPAHACSLLATAVEAARLRTDAKICV